jgi:DNA-binding IclR family transcriptional regulator
MAAYLKVPSGDSVVTVDAAIPPRAWLPNFEIGRRFPMHRSSMGKAMLAARGEAAVTAHVDALKSAGNEDVVLEDEEAFLAEMAQARERGYAVNQVPGSSQHSIGAPIRRFDSQVVGAVGVGFRADAGVLGSPREHEVSHEVLTTARSISFAIGYQADRLI